MVRLEDQIYDRFCDNELAFWLIPGSALITVRKTIREIEASGRKSNHRSTFSGYYIATIIDSLKLAVYSGTIYGLYQLADYLL